MKSKTKSALAAAAVLSLLLIGMVPVMAQVNTSAAPSQATTNSTSTSSQSTQSTGAATLIQLAQAAQAYADKLLTIAQQNQVNVTQAQSLITEGGQLLTNAQNELGTNSTQAAQDAISAMKDFRSAAQSLQSGVITVLQTNALTALQAEVQHEQNVSSKLQGIVTKACSYANSSATLCADANGSLTQANSNITEASSILSSLTVPVNSTIVAQVDGLLKNAQTDLQQVYTDLTNMANAARDQKAVDYVQTVLIPGLTKFEGRIQNSNLSSSVIQQDEAQLASAGTLLNDSITTFQSGNFTGGVAQVQSATQQVQDVAQAVPGQMLTAYIQNTIEPKLAELQQAAQNPNLNSTVAQEVQSQLSQAQSLLNSALQSIQSGNLSGAAQQVQQAMQLMVQAMQELAHSAKH